jgi:uroporphyrinogen-III synthase
MNRPLLHPHYYFITRPLIDAQNISKKIQQDDQNSIVRITPLLNIQACLSGQTQWQTWHHRIDPNSNSNSAIKGVIVTSKNALRHLPLSCLTKEGLLDPRWSQLPWLVVGSSTGQLARKMGIRMVIEAEGSASSLSKLVKNHNIPGNAPWLYIAGRDQAYPLCHALIEEGIVCEEMVLYEANAKEQWSQEEQEWIQQAYLHSALPVTWLFFSKRTLQIWHRLTVNDPLIIRSKTELWCWSQAIANEALDYGIGTNVMVIPSSFD